MIDWFDAMEEAEGSLRRQRLRWHTRRTPAVADQMRWYSMRAYSTIATRPTDLAGIHVLQVERDEILPAFAAAGRM